MSAEYKFYALQIRPSTNPLAQPDTQSSIEGDRHNDIVLFHLVNRYADSCAREMWLKLISVCRSYRHHHDVFDRYNELVRRFVKFITYHSLQTLTQRIHLRQLN